MNNSEKANFTLKKITNYVCYRSVVFLLIINLTSFNQVFSKNYFEISFGQSGSDVSRSVIQLSSGSIFTAGYSDTAQLGNIDFAINKFSENGLLIYTKYFGDSLVDNCLGMCLINNSQIIMCGEKYTSNNSFDGIVYKLDTLGNILWELQIGELLKNESIKYIFQTSDGNLLACGFITDSNFSNDFLVVKISSSGNLIWQKTFGDDNNNTANMCIELSNGNYAIVGDAQSHLGDYDVMIVVTDIDGNEIWENRFGNNLQNGSQGIFESSDNKLIVYGETEIFTASPFDFFAQKITFTGNSLWRKTFGGTKSDAIFNGIEIADGFVFTGYSNSYNAGPLNLVVLKTDTTASNIEWARNYGSTGVDIGYQIIKSKTDSGFYIVGIYDDLGNTNNYLLHINNDGLLFQDEIISNSIGKLYPNPSSGKFSIDSKQKIEEVIIYNTVGEIIYSQLAPEKEINLNNINKGLYFVHTKTQINKSMHKLILE